VREKEWTAMAELAKVSPIPLGLDGSIYDMKSVDKARQPKCAQSVLVKALGTGGGNIRLTPDYKLQLGEEKVEKFAINQMVIA
jgi:hypothetical protein